ncbi:MAG: hypothetical protein WC421_08975 [Elusimicrobiales bacterium]
MADANAAAILVKISLMLDYQSNPRRHENITAVCLLSGLAAILIARVYATPYFLGDERFWNTGARLWSEGALLYANGIPGDNKLPGIFYIHRLSNWLFAPTPYFARLIAAALQLGGALAVYGITRRFMPALERLWCLAAYVAVISTSSTDVGNGGTTEAFLHPFCALAFFIYGSGGGLRSAALAGLSMGVAICFKQSAALPLAALMCWPLLERRGLKEPAAMLASAAAVCALALLPILIQGTTVPQLCDALRPIRFLMPSRSALPLFDWYVWLEWLPSFALILYVLIPRREAWPFLIWLAADVIAVNVPGKYFSHQFKQMVPSFAMCSGMAMAVVLRGRPPQEQFSILARLVALFFIFTAAITYFAFRPVRAFWL